MLTSYKMYKAGLDKNKLFVSSIVIFAKDSSIETSNLLDYNYFLFPILLV